MTALRYVIALLLLGLFGSMVGEVQVFLPGEIAFCVGTAAVGGNWTVLT